MTQSDFEEYMRSLYDDCLEGQMHSISILEDILIVKPYEFDPDIPWNPANLINKETCTDADINYIKELYTSNGLGYGGDNIGCVYINGHHYLLNKKNLSYITVSH